ncbi:LON peptidase N-terminal domain and RING finger 2 [Pelobates cultripes]|uniref:LON peptidase N-terminal domain and RING finger 2 n=1 Tax=Pelobates cultripes TaxID=61616 RepID=A0AAD1VQ47_PELCU|nr:LON peptidase N-terminal domain and RING finger 2 [Pelobates cultripes]
MEVRSVPSSNSLPLDLPGISSEMLGVAEEAFRAGNFELAAEIYGSQLDELPHPERSLHVRRGDALALAGKIADALNAYTKAAMLGRLHPEELGVLVESIALNIREKELKLPCFRRKDDHGPINEAYQAPGDFLLAVRRTELHLAMKNFKQALIDADNMCRKHLLWPKARSMKAQALSGLGRTEEAMKEFLYCVAINPEWSSMKTEAQKIMCDVFFPAFENVQASLKPVFLNSTNSPSSVKDVSFAGCSEDSLFRLTKASSLESDLFQMKDFLDNAQNTPGNILSCLPSTGLKRKHASNSEEPHSVEITAKFLKKDTETLCEQVITGTKIREIHMVLVDAADFECSLCMRLFYEPVATPCGHTFCLKCLERCLDHNPHCPLCKENLSQYLASRAYKKTHLTEELITRYLPEDLTERKKLHDEEIQELSNLNKDVPIFVCTMAFPTIPCPLHVFEPRYRLMIRRSMETGTKQFGMCIADELKGFADYGCMLRVRDVKFFPDGRSVVDTVGLSRFKVLSHGQRDGYHTANIEYLEDKKVEGQEYEELLALHNSVYDQALVWFTYLKDNLKAQILSHFGQMPSKESELQANSSGPAWCWWMLAVLPLENKAQLTILAMTSLKDRLLAIRRVLMFVTRKRPR